MLRMLLLFGLWVATAHAEGCKFGAFAIEPAQKAVIERLKAPATAKFSPPEETKVTCDGELHTVRGWVDAQNGFGALIRNRYEVKLQREENTTFDGKHDPKDDLWKVMGVNFSRW